MATHSSILAWRIPGTEEPGRLQSMGSNTTERLTQRKNIGGKGSGNLPEGTSNRGAGGDEGRKVRSGQR